MDEAQAPSLFHQIRAEPAVVSLRVACEQLTFSGWLERSELSGSPRLSVLMKALSLETSAETKKAALFMP